MKFKAVIFDLFGTLVNDFGSSGAAIHMRDMASALGIPHEPFAQLWAQTINMRIDGAFDSVVANIKHVCDAMNADPRPEQIAAAVEIRMHYVRQALQPKSNAIDTLARLKTRAYRTGLLSNCSIEIPLLWHETAFANLIDAPVFSARVRLKKPDPRIFHLACERLGFPAASCLYIADGEDHELTAALKIGLHPVLFRPRPELPNRKTHEETKNWRGATISNLLEVLEILENRERLPE